ncbi:autotransporter outer membrane beta-barrel domain-containing protein [Paraburkholderia sp. UCT31]|uniref:autotransporter outer membrane beta-barrel domain-containing protein n=1 Tax=Paraburkholderia sp. UCT31 TaxID=2615209 RepID=UPI00292A5A9D|nr:autotransporter outer membrane beta-barrel domain-containing protein [Paraburkholderia sp. UCT31]MBC8742909.1 autotransporter outer membrane beta-barrel domain-containing protein [Paraburkholderia sp. UCT31]
MLAALQPSERAMAQPPCIDSTGAFVAEEIDGCGGYGGGATTGNTPSTGGASNPLGAGTNGSGAATTSGGSGGGGGAGAGTAGATGGAGGAGGGTAGGSGGSQGANGNNGGPNSGGGGGGAGAHGVLPSSLENPAGGVIAGGNGGNGGNGGVPSGAASIGGGGAGAGGYGLVINSGVSLTNNGQINGGAGGTGGNGGVTGSGSIQGSAGEGGDGGFGVFVNLNATGVGLTNTGTIQGGRGGNSGNGNFTEGGNGSAGIRATAVNATPINTFSIENSGTIRGGNGGDASLPTPGAITIGGNGGAGISGSSLTITDNSGGTIQGGNGGATLRAGSSATSSGGVGIVGDNLTIYNSGNIIGGFTGGNVPGGVSPSQVNAITFTGGANYLELRQGFVIGGNVVVQSGASGTLALGGSNNGSFSASSVGAAAQYQGFTEFVKTGSSVWTLTGTPVQAGTPWTLLGGELSVASGVSLGTPANSGLTFNGGILQVTGTGYIAIEPTRGITWAANGGGFDVADGANVFTVSQNLDNGGQLTKLGLGTLVLTGSNTYVGDTLLGEGTISVGNGSALGNASQSTLRMANGTTLSFTNGNFTVANNIAITGTGNFTPPSGTVQTLSGTISDGTSAGTLAMQAPGTLVLAADNSYSGGTTISAGTLQVGDGGSTGSVGSGAILDNGALVFHRSDTVLVPGAITGRGNLTQDGVDGGTIVLTGGNTYTGGTTISAGTLQLGNGGTSGGIVGNVTDNGTLAFNRSDTVTFAGKISGTGDLAQIGSGTTILTNSNPYAGGTTVNAGTLVVGDPAHPSAALSGGGPVVVESGATLGGFGTVTGAVTNDGMVAAGNGTPGFGTSPAGTFTVIGNLLNRGTVNLASDPIVGNVLSVSNGNYAGAGGRMNINTVLAGDNSPSDKLVIIGGTATGNTLVHVTNAGGAGALTVANGIPVVEAIDGGTTAAGAFGLAGEVRGGAFTYDLFRGGHNGSNPDDWFLRSDFQVGPSEEPDLPPGEVPPSEEPGIPNGDVLPLDPPPAELPPGEYPIIGPEIATYSVVQPLARQLGLTMLGTMHERIGDTLTDTGGGTSSAGIANSAWVRVFGQQIDNHYETYTDSRANGRMVGVQAGVDLWRGSFLPGHHDATGVYFAYGNSNVDVDGLITNADATAYVLSHTGSVNLNAYSGGAYWTHYGPGGWYIDAILQGTHYDGDATTQFARLPISGSGFATSLEVGYPFHLPLGPGFVLEPQAQVIWQHIGLSENNDGLGSVDPGSTSGVTGRLGVRGQWSIERANGEVWQPYLRANIWRDWGAQATTTYSGVEQVPLAQQFTRMDFAAGVTAKLDARMSLYGQFGYQFSINSSATGSRKGVWGDIGLRYLW